MKTLEPAAMPHDRNPVRNYGPLGDERLAPKTWAWIFFRAAKTARAWRRKQERQYRAWVKAQEGK